MFSSSFDENHANYQPYYGWNRANSNEYSTHVPSAVPIIPITFVSPSFGQYPNHGQFNSMMTYEGEAPHHTHSQHKKHQHAPSSGQYPTLGQFNSMMTYEGEVPHHTHGQHQKHQHAPQAHKGRVHFAEHDRITDHAPQARKGRVHFAEHDTVTEVVDRKNGRLEVHQDSIDAEADGFIRLKHKNFELSKWDTFKGY